MDSTKEKRIKELEYAVRFYANLTTDVYNSDLGLIQKSSISDIIVPLMRMLAKEKRELEGKNNEI